MEKEGLVVGIEGDGELLCFVGVRGQREHDQVGPWLPLSFWIFLDVVDNITGNVLKNVNPL